MRAGGEKPFQGQHGNITFSCYKATVSYGEATLEQESSQRAAGRRTRPRTRSSVSKISDNEMIAGDRCTVWECQREEDLVDLTYILS